jgi:Rad3-related DNA helicase
VIEKQEKASRLREEIQNSKIQKNTQKQQEASKRLLEIKSQKDQLKTNIDEKMNKATMKRGEHLQKILEKNDKNKGIIHTSNYELSNWIKTAIKDGRLLFHDSQTREKTLEQHLTSKLETVLVSPSMINGVDLKDDFSRFQVILKVPFPNLVSTKIKKRLETRPDWYNWKTLVDLLQAYGRSIRNDDDWAETYILDECFDQILDKKTVPQYFLEALKIKKLSQK